MTLLTRPGCGLCEDLLPHLEVAARWLRVDLTVLDITGRPEFEDEYHLRIPVVLDVDGRVLAEGQIGRVMAWRAVWRGR